VTRRLRLRDEGGFTLVEMVVVVAILSLVLGGVTTVFLSGSRAELQVNNRFQAQEAARLALAAIRQDAHTACSAEIRTISGKQQLFLSVPIVNRVPNPPVAPTATTQCGTVSPNMSQVIWCTGPGIASSTKFALYRSTSGSCPSSSKLVADNLVNNLTGFTAFFTVRPATNTTAIPPGETITVDVDIPVSLKVGTSGTPFDLKERLALPNTVWGTTTAQVCSEGTPCGPGPCPHVTSLGVAAGPCYTPKMLP
jgi:prepilin-type N-terminal cleavage/methylation domain-containing protein